MQTANGPHLDQADIVRHLRAILPELRMRYGVHSLALFGSYARSAAHSGSDIDLLVEFERTPSLLQLIELEQRISDSLGARADLVLRRALRPEILHHVLAELVAI